MPTWTGRQAAASTSATQAFPSNVLSGSLLIACSNNDTIPSVTPTDSLGGTDPWHLIRTTTTANSEVIAWWYRVTNTSGACTVTFTDGAFDGYAVAEITVDTTPIALDVENTAYRSAVAAGTDAVTSATVTVAQADSLALSFIGTDNSTNSATIPAGTGFTKTFGANTASTTVTGGQDQTALEWDQVNAGSLTPAWSPTQTTSGQVHVAVFKAGTGAPQNQIAWIVA